MGEAWVSPERPAVRVENGPISFQDVLNGPSGLIGELARGFGQVAGASRASLDSLAQKHRENL